MRRLCLSVVFLVSLIGGTAAALAASLVGTWASEVSDGHLVLVLNADGSLAMTLGDSGTTAGTWSADGDKLTLVLKDPNSSEQATFNCAIVLTDTSLTIQPGDQECGTTTLTRQN